MTTVHDTREILSDIPRELIVSHDFASCEYIDQIQKHGTLITINFHVENHTPVYQHTIDTKFEFDKLIERIIAVAERAFICCKNEKTTPLVVVIGINDMPDQHEIEKHKNQYVQMFQQLNFSHLTVYFVKYNPKIENSTDSDVFELPEFLKSLTL